MTLTIELPPDVEAMLHADAEEQGKDAATVAVELLAEVLQAQARDFEESCAAIAEALADESGDMPFEEYVRQEQEKRLQSAVLPAAKMA